MKNWIIGILLVALIACIYLLTKPQPTINTEKWEQTIDSLQGVLNTIKPDTIRIHESNNRIDSITISKDKNYIDRIHADLKSDLTFWIQYLYHYKTNPDIQVSDTLPLVNKDSMIIITPNQVKKSDLIFLELDYTKALNKELNVQIIDYKSLVKDYISREGVFQQQVSILTAQTSSYKNDLANLNLLVKTKNESLKRTKKWLTGTSIVCVGLLTILLVK